jgi:Ca2+-binding EF-hand superfamily protein
MRYLIWAAALVATCAAEASAQQTRFQGMDRNGDGRITREEWRGNARAFARHDWNNDGVLTGDEVRTNNRGASNGRSVFDSDVTDWTDGHFSDLDQNDDGRLTQAEWFYDIETYRRIDRNRDGVVSRDEFLGLDLIGGRWDRFDNLDANRDGVLTRDEVAGRRAGGAADGSTRAYQRGYEQGLIEGRKAGREDKQLRNRWDLEGQGELEQADSGYRQEMGVFTDYQDGYRSGFRVGYGEGFGRR